MCWFLVLLVLSNLFFWNRGMVLCTYLILACPMNQDSNGQFCSGRCWVEWDPIYPPKLQKQCAKQKSHIEYGKVPQKITMKSAYGYMSNYHNPSTCMIGACGGIPLQFPRIWGDQPAVCFVAAIRPDIYSNLPIGTMSGKTVYVNVYIYIYMFLKSNWPFF